MFMDKKTPSVHSEATSGDGNDARSNCVLVFKMRMADEKSYKCHVLLDSVCLDPMISEASTLFRAICFCSP